MSVNVWYVYPQTHPLLPIVNKRHIGKKNAKSQETKVGKDQRSTPTARLK